ncbi:MAG: purine-nucleoside phosphorylase [Acidiferrobacteraceae bacterium]|nr:purine-nucleoside phosphorylase [Acidiferrobacteraceae bacterium]|tara:strand:- start:184 stop:1005 length:822 start_codon:yes stop_codon:yes gene_type:complete
MDYQKSADYIRSLAGYTPPKVGLILGSGLGALAESISSSIKVSYNELPGFSEPTVSGHDGQLILGTWSGVNIACLQGRSHLYEGHHIQRLTVPIRALKSVGCKVLVLTCAAGSLREEMRPGDLMLVTDHINWPGLSPLIGPNDDGIGPRFLDVSHAYDPTLREFARQTAENVGVILHEGVYIWCLGPNFETPAEIRAFRQIGADAVGMSIVPECLTAVHCGLKVLAISVVTNLAAGLQSDVSHAETLAIGKEAIPKIKLLLDRFMQLLGENLQ